MTLRASALYFVAFSPAALAQTSPTQYETFGSAGKSFGAFVHEYRNALYHPYDAGMQAEMSAYDATINAFLSDFNHLSVIAGRPGSQRVAGRYTDLQSRMAWLMDWCDKKPLEDLETAVAALHDALASEGK